MNFNTFSTKLPTLLNDLVVSKEDSEYQYLVYRIWVRIQVNSQERGKLQTLSMCWLIFPICLVLPFMVSKLAFRLSIGSVDSTMLWSDKL